MKYFISFRFLSISGLLLLSSLSFAQQNSMGVNTTAPNPNAVLHLVSPNSDQGLLIPVLTTAQRTAMSLATSDSGLLVYDSDLGDFYFWKDTVWNLLKGLTTVNVDGTTVTGDGNGTPLAVGANSITNTQLANDAVQSGSILDGTIVDADINDVAVGKITGAPNLDTDATDDVATGTTPAAGDVSGSYTAGFTVDNVGSETAIDVATATLIVTSNANLDLDSTDDVATGTTPAAGDVSGSYTAGCTVDNVGSEAAPDVATAT
ncbi:MAG: hypothetical protein GY816_20960 [Cytophagales bacterium]|nr:hypothetical protein [Cytophagales bacterium]